MGSVLRAVIVYSVLYIIYRIAGKRSLAELKTFDLLVLLIISETTQQAMVAHDNSVINAVLLISTLVGMDILLSLLKQRWPRLERALESLPLILLENGQLHHDRMDRERIDETDILAAARKLHGLERMDQIKYAILEQDGSISIIPREAAQP